MEIIEIKPPHAAIVDGICMMTVIDGVLDPDELDFLSSMISSMLAVPQDVTEALIQNSLGRLKSVDDETYVEHIIERLPLPDHQHTMLVALQLASLSDGVLKRVELALLDDFVQRFGMNDEAIAAAKQEATTLYKNAMSLSENVSN